MVALSSSFPVPLPEAPAPRSRPADASNDREAASFELPSRDDGRADPKSDETKQADTTRAAAPDKAPAPSQPADGKPQPPVKVQSAAKVGATVTVAPVKVAAVGAVAVTVAAETAIAVDDQSVSATPQPDPATQLAALLGEQSSVVAPAVSGEKKIGKPEAEPSDTAVPDANAALVPPLLALLVAAPAPQAAAAGDARVDGAAVAAAAVAGQGAKSTPAAGADPSGIGLEAALETAKPDLPLADAAPAAKADQPAATAIQTDAGPAKTDATPAAIEIKSTEPVVTVAQSNPIDLSGLALQRPVRHEAASAPPDPAQALAQAQAANGQHTATGAAEGQPTPLHVVPIEIGLRALSGSKRFDIRLDPAELGRIDVKLEISDKGEVSARLTVDRVETLHLLQRDARTLEKAFEQAGLRPSDGGVDINLRDQSDQSGFRQRQQDDDAPGRRARAGIETTDDVSANLQPVPARQIVRLGGVDLSI